LEDKQGFYLQIPVDLHQKLRHKSITLKKPSCKIIIELLEKYLEKL